jgi:two-component system LytT family response regulator
VKVRALIAEDEPLARRHLRELLGETDWIDCVGEAEDGAEAVRLIDELEPDLVFLDIQMPELTGLQVLERLSHRPAVIFTTAYDRYAVSAFELEAIDYLLKPFGRDRLDAALDRARRTLATGDSTSIVDRARHALDDSGPLQRLLVRDRGRLLPITTPEIERLEAQDDYVALHVRGRAYLVYLSMNDFEQRLDPSRFLRIHRSHIVNLDFVSQLVPYDGSRMLIEMRDGTKILASRARSRELRQRAV